MKQKSGKCSRQPKRVIGNMQTDKKKKHEKNSLALTENNMFKNTVKSFM